MQDFEKLGQFYLGREYDLSTRKSRDDLILYDSSDLVTHAVCVGMTGSGKTGLCIGLLEEAAIDGIPAIVIDPKGDLANLALTFPQLRAEDFKPWVNADDARKKQIDVDTFAEQQATLWKTGLAKWGEDGARIQRLRDAAEVRIYTPGSSAGISVSILKSFAAPDESLRDDAEMFRERIATTATSLLGLLGIDADPIRSREHILLSNILSAAWSKGKDLDMATLIGEIQKPSITKVGVLDLESFYPQKDRFELAMQLNNLLAAPGFGAWMEGEPLDIQAMLYTPQGKPRIAVFSIAHLGDSERMFFVSLLLNQVLGWTRAQSGTTSLRAIVYMDEIFGYFPPVANPPSKQPLLTLLKQGRAFGVGVVLATQNPVDLDYKGLANCGTWFIGRLQTERDKQRVLEGLEGAAAGASQKFDRAAMEQTLAGLGSRVFLMNNVHEDAPVTFETRWTLSYLRGPLGRQEIKRLMDGNRPATPMSHDAQGVTSTVTRPAVQTDATSSSRPMLPPTIQQYFVPVQRSLPRDTPIVYHPRILGTADVYFGDRKAGVDLQEKRGLLADIGEAPLAVKWDDAKPFNLDETALENEPESTATFAPLPAAASNTKSYPDWTKSFAEALYRTSELKVFRSEEADLASKPGETEGQFRTRLTQTFRERQDAAKEAIRLKYAAPFARIQEQIRTAEQRKSREATEASTSKWTAAISIGTSLMGAFLGRKKISATNIGRMGTAARTVGQTMKQSGDVARADEMLEARQAQLVALQQKFEAEVQTTLGKLDALTVPLTTVTIRPKKTDVKPRLVALAWLPYVADASGRPAWESA